MSLAQFTNSQAQRPVSRPHCLPKYVKLIWCSHHDSNTRSCAQSTNIALFRLWLCQWTRTQLCNSHPFTILALHPALDAPEQAKNLQKSHPHPHSKPSTFAQNSFIILTCEYRYTHTLSVTHCTTTSCSTTQAIAQNDFCKSKLLTCSRKQVSWHLRWASQPFIKSE